jgi:uncharacterized membrane protein
LRRMSLNLKRSLSARERGLFRVRLLDKAGLPVTLCLALIYTVYFSSLCLRKYQAYAYSDFDLAIYQQVLYNTAQGDLFYSSIRWGVFFKDHLSIILAFLVPFFTLFHEPEFLLVLQSLFIGAGAVPLFLLASKKLNATFGVAFAAAYVLYPPLAHANLFEFHPGKLGIPLMIWALYYFFERRFPPFFAFLVLAVLCREDISFAAFLLGFYALWHNWCETGRPFSAGRRKWVLGPAVFGFVYIVVAFKVVIPHFNPEGGYIYFRSLYGKWGSSMVEVVFGVLSNPREVLATIFADAQLKYLFHLFSPTLFLSMFSPLLLFVAAPFFAANLLSSSPTTYGIYFQYTSSLVPFIFVSAVLGTRWLLGHALL